MGDQPKPQNRFHCPRCELRVEDCPAKRIYDCLDPTLETALTRSRVARRYDAGVTVIHHETPALAVLTVHAGSVRLLQPLPGGRSAPVAVRGPGEMIGVREVLAEAPYQVTVETREPSVVCSVPRAEFRKAVGGCAELAFRLLRMLARDILIAKDQLWIRAHTDVAERTARFVHALATGVVSEHGPRGPMVKADRAEMAMMIGASHEALAEALQDLAACGAIEISGETIEVLDLVSLESQIR